MEIGKSHVKGKITFFRCKVLAATNFGAIVLLFERVLLSTAWLR